MVTLQTRSRFRTTALAALTFASILVIIITFSVLSRNPQVSPSSGSFQNPHNYYHRNTIKPHQKISSSSPHLISRLRAYERHHSRCQPQSQSFNQTIHQLLTNKNNSNSNPAAAAAACNYIVYTPENGLGNRMLSLASAFLYALLTNRTLLVNFGPDMTDLFREPFPNSTWLLPRQDSTRVFDDATTLHFRDAHNYIHYLLLYLPYRCRNYEKFFFRDENQKRIESVPWLILHSDQYFLPYLFLMPCFRPELDRLFPNRETVFHQLGRYLFSPSHQAWGFISTFYETFLSKADERIGIQIRVFNDSRGKPTPLVMKHVLSCTRKQGILNRTGNRAVLVASLSGDFYRELKVNATGVGVYQASQEESQRLGDASHNMKAWVDMYLLSMCDVLLTSAWSTFGYVAHGLGGVKPWILQIPDIGGAGDGGEAECRRAVSAEPCFHNPPDFDCPEGFVSPVVRCEDVGKGMKLVNQQPII